MKKFIKFANRITAVETLPDWILAAAVATFLLIVLGYLVRASGSGLGCPDWPTCYGQWGFPSAAPAQVQYLHRALALLAGLLTAASLWIGLRGGAPRAVRGMLAGALGLTAAAGVLGALGIRLQNPAALNPIHLALAVGAQSLLIAAAVYAFSARSTGLQPRFAFPTRFGKLVLLSAAALLIVTASGMIVAGAASPHAWLEIAHRLLSFTAGMLVLVLLVSAWRRERGQRVILTAATGTAILFLMEGLVGAVKVARGYPAELVGLHAVTTAGLAAMVAVLVAAVGLESRTTEEEEQAAAEPVYFRERAKDLLILTKPVIVLLLLVTTYAGMVVGGRQIPALGVTFWTILGGALAAGGSSAINQYIDRDLDRNMQRTARRPLAAQRMTPAEGLAFGLALCLLAFYLLASFVNLLAALLSLAGMIYYVLIYSIFLKRATVQNIVIGGGAGAIPPLVGWAAATGGLSVPALFLFAIIFLWTPPHFWALALVRRKDYARAGVPMLPVVKGEQVTRVQILVYTLELVGLTLLMPVFHLAGSVYLVSALLLGSGLIFAAWRVLRVGGNKTAYWMYRYSSMYLALLFLALALDVFVRV